jgi:protein-tyrosine-phosphatase
LADQRVLVRQIRITSEARGKPAVSLIASASQSSAEARKRVKKVLFVCTANICRSPMAQELFNALAENAGLPFRAESAGTAALEGTPMADKSVAVLEEAGIHHARQVSEAMVGEAELVLAMTPQHVATLRRLGGNPPRGIHTLPEYATGIAGEGIADPYGLTMAAHRSTLRQLYVYVECTVDCLKV